MDTGLQLLGIATVAAVLWAGVPTAVLWFHLAALTVRHISVGVDALDPEVKVELANRIARLQHHLELRDPVVPGVRYRVNRALSLCAELVALPFVWRHAYLAQTLVYEWHAGGRGVRIVPAAESPTGGDDEIPLYIYAAGLEPPRRCISTYRIEGHSEPVRCIHEMGHELDHYAGTYDDKIEWPDGA